MTTIEITTETSKLWDIYNNLEQEHEFSIDDYEDDQDIEYDWPEYKIPDSDIVLNGEALRAIHEQQQQPTQPLHIRGALGEATTETIKAHNANHLIGLDNNPKNSEIDSMQSKGSSIMKANSNDTIITSTTTTTTTTTTMITYSDNTMTFLLVLCIVIWLVFQFKVCYI